MTTSVIVTAKQLYSNDKKAQFSISELKNGIGNIARPNLWIAELLLNQTLYNIGVPENFSFRCEKAEIPGRTVATVDDTGSGPALKLPYEVTYSDIEITIICSTDMDERIFFEKWINSIVGEAKDANDTDRTATTSISSGLVNYYDNYANGNKLILRQVDEKGQTLIKYTLHDVYPIQISPMNLSWEETNTYQRFNTTLNYRYYTL